MTNEIEIPEAEAYLRGYLRPDDQDLDAVRARARRATVGEVIRRDRDPASPPLHVRQVTLRGVTTSATTTRVVLDPAGQPTTKTTEGADPS